MPKLLTKFSNFPCLQTNDPREKGAHHIHREDTPSSIVMCVFAVELRFKSISNPKASRPNQEPARQKSLDAGCFFFSSTKLGGVVFAF